ncbi:ABC transporter ATP-binding protein, partial [Leuconostoc pseudomesenteroides]|uniref:ABC transporter ATP-binding protein n=1 Tax=Leuconostoc pseudomesenteroides TaxID=33968 RepID=UPI0032DFFF54
AFHSKMYKLLRRILMFFMIIKQNLRPFFIWLAGFVFILIAGYYQILIPRVVQDVVNKSVTSNFDNIKINRIISLFLVISITSLLGSLFVGITSEKIVLNVRNNYFKNISRQKVYNLPYSFSELANRLTNDAEVIGKMFNSTLTNFFKEFFVLIGSLIILINVNKKVFLLLVISFLLLTIFISVLGSIISVYSEHFKQASSDYLKNILNMFDNWESMKVFHLENFFQKREKIFSKKMYIWSIKGLIVSVLSGPLQAIFFSVIIIIMIYIVGMQLNSGEINSGSLAALILILMNLTQSLFGTFNNFLDLKNDIGQLRGLKSIYIQLSKPDTANQKNRLEGHSNKNIILNNVSFFYNKKKILENVTYVFNKNKFTIFGPNGEGKSTLMMIILGIKNPSTGKIIIPSNYNMSYIPQHPKFLIGSVRENIAIGRNIDDDKIIKLLKEINIWESLKERGGLDLHLDSNCPLSGGELQKLIIIRGIIGEYDILICDEITSNLDRKSKKIVYKMIDRLSINKKIIEIDHDRNINEKVSMASKLYLKNGVLEEHE